VAAVLAACGGGDDSGWDDTASISGIYSGCEPINGVPLASKSTTLDIDSTSMVVTHRVYAGSRACGGLLAAEVVFPYTRFTDAGTKVVGAPNGGTITARKAIFTSEQDEIAATIDGSIEHAVVNGELIIYDPNSDGELYRVDVLQPADSYKDVLVRYNGALYFGSDAVDSEGFSTGIDYSAGWAAH